MCPEDTIFYKICPPFKGMSKDIGIEVTDNQNHKYIIKKINHNNYIKLDDCTNIKLRDPLTTSLLYNLLKKPNIKNYDKQIIENLQNQKIHIDEDFRFEVGETYKIRLFNKNL